MTLDDWLRFPYHNPNNMHVFIVLLWFLYAILQLLIISYLVQPFLLFLVYLVRKKQLLRVPIYPFSPNSKKYHFGVIITAHRETAFLPPIIDSLLRQTHPFFNVYIVADDCDISQLQFADPRIRVLRPPEALNTNTKSIDYAIRHFEDTDEIMVIFDPDNLVHPSFLEVLNGWYNKGFRVVQGNLCAKNSRGKYEKIDSCGVLFNNFIDRDMRSLLGFSINIWGSGISIDRMAYQTVTYNNRSQHGGFDKRMQLEIIKNIGHIAYARNAIVFDEKVSDGINLEQQRIRWISSYFKFWKDSAGLLLEGIRSRNPDHIYFGYNLLRPPYFLGILSALLFTCIHFPVFPWLSGVWMGVLLVFVLSFTLIISTQAQDKGLTKGIFFMPLLLYHQIRSFIQLRKNRTSILKTGHSKIIYIEDLLKAQTTNEWEGSPSAPASSR